MLRQYLRTTYRLMFVKDKQVNSGDVGIRWNDVMESNDATGMTGVNSELKVGTMGRFQVLSDRTFTLDGTNPQKMITQEFKRIGKLRYNGPDSTVGGGPALTDKGIYPIWAVYVMGAMVGHAGLPASLKVKMSGVLLSSRMSFTDA